jgi:hypothetical protein
MQPVNSSLVPTDCISPILNPVMGFPALQYRAEPLCACFRLARPWSSKGAIKVPGGPATTVQHMRVVGRRARYMDCSLRDLRLHIQLEAEAMTPTRRHIENLVMRIQSAFLYDPALTLTLSAARTRFGIDGVTCAGVLKTLVDAGVLTIQEGTYRRYFPRPIERRAA